MVSDSIALDMMFRVVQRLNRDGGSISTEELQKLAGNDWTAYNGTISKRKAATKITHRFGRVVETNGMWYVAVGVVGERWMRADEEGPVMAERYKLIKAENDARNAKYKNGAKEKIVHRVNTWNYQHKDQRIMTGTKAWKIYCETGELPDSVRERIKTDDLL